MQVLVVEDEKWCQDHVQRLLSELSFADVTLCTYLEEAEPHMAEADLVVLDLQLPDGDGEDFAANYPGAPIIFLSGMPMAHLAIVSKRSGRACLPKDDYGYSQLIAVVKTRQLGLRIAQHSKTLEGLTP